MYAAVHFTGLNDAPCRSECQLGKVNPGGSWRRPVACAGGHQPTKGRVRDYVVYLGCKSIWMASWVKERT